ncbi:HAD family hydrolase [Polycladomyces subterraneus]|uniref:HAD family hydrolase n=1 Tax=Polycladomyces subterraneus TaxID=1016997 RepID=A0ABT8IRA4_9BACL|nr:HAD family hydrolase [Polycladomyces subterraneus]MDN4595309.1 HAD family hydrolase [Polycladomyces subterraneus]
MVACLIFDLEDTLCDYRQAMENAKQKVSDILRGIGVDPASFWTRYHQLEPVLFQQFTEKKLTVEEYRVERYADVLREWDKSKLEWVDRLNAVYMNEANHRIQLFEDVIPFLANMKKNGVMGAVLTNGPADGQRNKMAALGLTDYVDKIYISAEIGYSKPAREAFQYVLDDLRLSATDVWTIGDSLAVDVKGAHQVGIKAILLDRANKYPDYAGPKVRSLIELL